MTWVHAYPSAARRILLHKESAMDKAKRRRNYLLKKWSATALIVAAAIVCGYGVLYVFIGLVQAATHSAFVPLLFWLVMSIATAITVGSALVFRSSLRTVRTLPHVPPVREPIAELPSDEILLRGSDEPAALPGELLRAAHAREAEPAEDLLRADC